MPPSLFATGGNRSNSITFFSFGPSSGRHDDFTLDFSINGNMVRRCLILFEVTLRFLLQPYCLMLVQPGWKVLKAKNISKQSCMKYFCGFQSVCCYVRVCTKVQHAGRIQFLCQQTLNQIVLRSNSLCDEALPGYTTEKGVERIVVFSPFSGGVFNKPPNKGCRTQTLKNASRIKGILTCV